ncbi:hypothetical protein ACQ4LE_006189 [Meloidogyne hapla]|uniref:Uncharacterized protein n=1 Tax=Meloidogyne hapla TaxID=6305 RepID=A0A1I8AZI5_MELHA
MSKIILVFCLFALFFANILSYDNDNKDSKIEGGNNKQVDLIGSRVKRWPCYDFMRSRCCNNGCRGFGCIQSACDECC